MNKKSFPLVLTITLIAAISFILKPGIEDLWTRFQDFTHPRYSQMLEKAWAEKSTDFLIDKLNHPSIKYSGVAMALLAQRHDEVKIGRILKIITQKGNPRGREFALSVLFSWDEKKASEVSMEIVRIGSNHPLYRDAMLHLAHIKYGPAFPYLVEMANLPDGPKNGSAHMLKDFGRLEAIPILENMLKNIKSEDPVVRDFLGDAILDAIQSIKENNGIN